MAWCGEVKMLLLHLVIINRDIADYSLAFDTLVLFLLCYSLFEALLLGHIFFFAGANELFTVYLGSHSSV